MNKRTFLANHLRTILITSIILSMCVSCNTANKESSPTADGTATFADQVLYTDTSGITWVPLQSVVHSLGLQMHDSEESVKIGYTDPLYEVYPGHVQALSLGSSTELKEAPTRWMGQPYISIDSIPDLLHTQVYWNQPQHRVELSALEDTTNVPSDPDQENTFRMTSTSVDTNALITYAKKYMGVPYVFGAKPYAQSKSFDCSSFTQHVFKQFNINLSRLASNQGKQGVQVSRENLNPGDLIFFTVPGRFKSSAIPGHVGIYMGDGKFIHTWGEPGVQISNLDTGHWSDVILFMRSMI